MTLSRRSLLVGGAAALGASTLPQSSTVRAQGAGAAKHLIVLLAYGGWDTTYALDPKQPIQGVVDTPVGQVTQFGDLPILTNATRPAVTGFFERYSAITTVLRGIQVRSLNHPDCTKRMLTGTQSEDNPDVGAIAAFELGRDLPAPYLVLGPTAYSGHLASISTRAGTVNQVRSLLTPEAMLPKTPEFATPRFEADAAEADLIRKYVEARTLREQALRGQLGYNAARYRDFLDSLGRSDVLKDFADGFGTDFSFTLDVREQIRLGLDAIQSGVCHSLHLEQTFASWDTHSGNDQQDALHENLYQALTLLADELTVRPGSTTGSNMMDETVVAVLSEMGRTPLLNSGMGKDHWPVTSALVFGAGIRGGRAYGASTDDLQARNVDYATGEPNESGQQLQYANVAATLLTAAGVDAQAYLPNVEVLDAMLA